MVCAAWWYGLLRCGTCHGDGLFGRLHLRVLQLSGHIRGSESGSMGRLYITGRVACVCMVCLQSGLRLRVKCIHDTRSEVWTRLAIIRGIVGLEFGVRVRCQLWLLLGEDDHILPLF